MFFPIVCALYFTFNAQRPRLWLLLLASCFFYGFFIPKYLLILVLVIAIDYFAARKIEKASQAKTKRLYLALSLIANVSILGFFKYINFLIFNVNQVSAFFHGSLSIQALNIILPIGLSFHTFQSMSYVFEVYYGRFKAEKDFLTYSIYVLYFPQLVAGPIERPQNVLPQLHSFQKFDYERTVTGLYLIAQGLFKKAVIADTLSHFVNSVYGKPTQFGALYTAFAFIFFSFQIYCDFSGYSDIARGTSRILGIELMLNFDKPYFATSMGEFWRRWHRSLSTWFRDYLFIPLGGSRFGWLTTQRNLFIVFMVSGLWHGANWTFVVWGGLHGAFLILESFYVKRAWFLNLPIVIRRIYVFSFVTLAWIFFRAKDFSEATQVITGLTQPLFKGFELIPAFRWLESGFAILALLFFESIDERKAFWGIVRNMGPARRWAFYWLAFSIFLLTAQFSGEQFIYFQF